MTFIKEFVLPMTGFVVVALLLTMIPITYFGNIEREQRAVVVEQCIEATPNDHKAIEHCMVKYRFIMNG